MNLLSRDTGLDSNNPSSQASWKILLITALILATVVARTSKKRKYFFQLRMKPVVVYTVRETKLFAGFNSLFAGLAFISIVGIIVLPIAHRLPHLLHLESKQSNLSYSALHN
jgi:hypothetical protein